MSEDERDTKFLHTAKLVANELCRVEAIPPGWMWLHAPEEEVCKLLARFAYDFALHVTGETVGTSDISHIPDLTEWSKQ